MDATSQRWLTPCGGRGAAVLTGALTLVVTLGGCTEATDGSAAPPQDAPLQIELVSQAGALSREERDELQQQVGDVLSAYVLGAFLGEYPRDDFVEGLTPFSSGAATQAAGDLDLLTARRYGEADDVRAERLLARVSTFAAAGDPAGATARVTFRFVVEEGESTTSLRMAGRFALAPDDGEWRIFGYEVTRQDAPVAPGADR